MKVGVMVTNYNSHDWSRLLAGDYSRPPATPDTEIVDNTLAFGALVEPLGFDSIWTAEHWGSPYSMQGDPLHWLSYWAARTERVDVGTAVLVLPWWDPVRLAHEMAMLDILLQGRRLIPGVGRGVSAFEYGSFRIPHEQSRERFREVLEVLRLADSQPDFEYDGQHYKIPHTMIRPAPRHKGHMLDGMRGAFSTPASAEMAARMGLGQMFVAGEPMDEMARKVEHFNAVRAAAGFALEGTTAMLMTRCLPTMTDHDLPEANQYYVKQLSDARNHYAVWKSPDFSQVKGYEEYATKYGAEDRTFKLLNRRGSQLVGTPDDIIAKVIELQEATNMDQLIVHTNHGGIPLEKAVASLKLFAAEVLPVLQRMKAPTPRVPEAAAAT